MYRAASLLAGRGPDLWRLWGCLTQASMWWASQIRPCSCPYFGTPCSPSHCSRARLPCWVVQTSTPIASASGASEVFLTIHGCFNLLVSSRLGSLELYGPSNKYNIKGEDLMPRQSTFSYPIRNQPRYITNSNGIKLQLKKARLEFHHDSQGTKTKKNKKTKNKKTTKCKTTTNNNDMRNKSNLFQATTTIFYRRVLRREPPSHHPGHRI